MGGLPDMEATGRTRARQLFEWLLSAASVLLAVLLIVQCVSIYHEGISPDNLGADGLLIHEIYSVEIVTAHFQQIAWSFYLWLVLLLLTIVLGKPAQKEKLTAPVRNQLAILRARTDDTADIRRLQRSNRLVWTIAGVVCFVCAVMAGRFLLNLDSLFSADGYNLWGSFASRDLEPVIRQLAISVFPWIGIAFAALMIAEELSNRLLQKEVTLRKTAPKKTPAEPAEKPHVLRTAVRIAVFCGAVALIVLGIQNGGMFDVLVKAINICTECIGLG
jgi:hypothetical protein